MTDTLFANLHVYQWWMLLILMGSFIICPLAEGMGAVYAWIRRGKDLPPVLPVPGSLFPTRADSAYTYIFLALFTLLSASSLLAENPDSKEVPQFTFSMALTNLAIYLPMLVRFVLLPRREWPPYPTRAQRWTSLFLFALLTMFVATSLNLIYEHSGLMQYIVSSTHCPEFQDVVEMIAKSDTTSRVLLIITAVVVAPVVEECCFRGFLYNSLKRRAGMGVAMVCSSLLFAAVHTSLAQMLPLTVFALLQCVLYEKTQTLCAPIISHAVFNMISVITVLFFYPNI